MRVLRQKLYQPAAKTAQASSAADRAMVAPPLRCGSPLGVSAYWPSDVSAYSPVTAAAAATGAGAAVEAAALYAGWKAARGRVALTATPSGGPTYSHRSHIRPAVTGTSSAHFNGTQITNETGRNGENICNGTIELSH